MAEVKTETKAAFRFYPSIESAGSASKKNRDFTGSNALWSLQEKIDGSQISVSTQDNVKLRFFCGKRERFLDQEEATSLFSKLMMFMGTMAKLLKVGYTYHGEAIQDLRHSTCTYNRLPRGFMVLYDVQDADGRWLTAKEMQAEAARLGLECAAVLHDNTDEKTDPFEVVTTLLQQIEEGKLESMLGGRPEGIVLKHPAYCKKSDAAPTAMKFKFVTKVFKEKQSQKKVRADRISPTDYIAWVGAHHSLRTTRRQGWSKRASICTPRRTSRNRQPHS
ncbi:MAG: hypothetical protein KGL39_23995 [Patescibacteria group bacterium]|nr:hypothetical protein [Patescibacteria group bacterium]